MNARVTAALAPLQEAIDSVASTVQTHKSRLDLPVVGVMPAYFPLELIVAARAYPVQLWGNNLAPGRSDAYIQSFACSLARSVLELELSGGATVVDAYAWSSICDTLVNLREIYRRVVPKPQVALEIPQSGSPQTRRHFLGIVLEHVLDELAAITGHRPDATDLAGACVTVGETRRLQRELYALRRRYPGQISNHQFYTALKAGFFLPHDAYNPMLHELAAALAEEPGEGTGPRIVVSGMYFEPFAMLREVFDSVGLVIANDDLANGSRTAFKGHLDVNDLAGGLDSYLCGPLPCCCIHNPALDRKNMLLQKVRESRASGVVFWYQKFCEPDAFDRPQIIEHLRAHGVPTAVLDVELFIRNFDAARNRMSAFAEMLTEQGEHSTQSPGRMGVVP